MSQRGRGKKSKSRRARRSGPSLSEHVRDHKTRQLVPPLVAAMKGRDHAVSWERDLMPEFLWTASLLVDEWPDRGEHHAALSRLDDLVPDGQRCLDSTLSSFELVPEEVRPLARRYIVETKALTDDFANALSLYPGCPARWLVEDWVATKTPSVASGLEYLKELVVRMRDGHSSYAAQLRWVVLGRLAKNGKLFLLDEMVDLMRRYPRELDEDERAKAESLIRASTLSMAGAMDASAPEFERTQWPRAFWTQNASLSPCERSAPVVLTDEDEPDSEVEPDRAITSTTATRARFVAAIEQLETDLQRLQQEVTLDLFEPVADEVRLGLASRQVRLLRRFVEQPSGWTVERAPNSLRPMVDTRIVAAWLVLKDDPKLFQRYKDYGQGKLKLLKLNLEEHVDQTGEDEATYDEYLEWLQARVDEDVLEQFQAISLAPSFADRSIFKMAQDVELKDLYNLVYSPLSGESHGDWGSLRLHDLERCTNPLHRYHRVGRFRDREEEPALNYLFTAVALMTETVEIVFDSYAVSPAEIIESFQRGFFSAVDRIGRD